MFYNKESSYLHYGFQSHLFGMVKFLLNLVTVALASVAQLVGALSYTPKGWGFGFWSGHIPRLWVQSPLRSEWEATNQCFSLTLVFLTLYPSISKISKHIKINNKVSHS